MVLSAKPSSSISLSNSPTCPSCSIMPSVYSSLPGWRWSFLTWVRKCIRVPFHQQKNGCPAAFCRLMKSFAAASDSSSMVSIRFFVSGPVFSIVWPPFPSALHLRTPRGPKVSRKVLPLAIFISAGKSSFSGSSSALRWYRLPKNSSKPCMVGRCSSRSPWWFLPNWPVA